MQSFKINNLPFYWRIANAGERIRNVVFDRFPFEFDTDLENNLLIQKRNPIVNDALKKVYQEEYNIGYLQDGNDHSKNYGNDFIKFLKQHISRHGNIKNILEIGCGGCLVLRELKKEGYTVTGVDSSPFAKNAGINFDINVVQDFFPTKQLTNKFDLIFHVDVLEHIDDYVGFLSSQYKILNDDGFIIVNVPDASESILLGDCSMAMHQHLNYFSKDSLSAILCSTGFNVISIVESSYGGSLYAFASKDKQSIITQSKSAVSIDSFQIKASIAYTSILTEINEVLKIKGRTVGFYAPLRALPYISDLNKLDKIRFFDDTSHWHNKYFDGIDIAIENFEDLTINPVTDMFIMSLTFGDVIKNKIQSKFGDTITIKTLRDLLALSL